MPGLDVSELLPARSAGKGDGRKPGLPKPLCQNQTAAAGGFGAQNDGFCGLIGVLPWTTPPAVIGSCASGPLLRPGAVDSAARPVSSTMGSSSLLSLFRSGNQVVERADAAYCQYGTTSSWAWLTAAERIWATMASSRTNERQAAFGEPEEDRLALAQSGGAGPHNQPLAR
ncbi:MAG: hypothetical protein IPK53_07455 [bacterium]|nr:hypothetical protein [bacterium]